MTARITSHHLRVPSFDGLSDFYVGVLGMRAVASESHLLAFALSRGGADLVFRLIDGAPFQAQPNDFYWKIGLTVRDLDAAVTHVRSAGIEVQPPSQFGDIGYLTKIADPTGFHIELLQQGFEGNSLPLVPGNPIGEQATVAHITLRVTNLAAAKSYFDETLGMRLMSVQPVPDYGFCLYFYGFSDEELPRRDLEAVANREWLWRRPYTLIELQHLQGSEAQVRKVDETDSGFDGFGYTVGTDEIRIVPDDLSQLW